MDSDSDELEGRVGSWVDSAVGAGGTRGDVRVGGHGSLKVHGGVLHGVSVTDGSVLECLDSDIRDGHVLVGLGICRWVLSICSGDTGVGEVVDGGVLHGVVIAHSRVLEVVVDGGVLHSVTVSDRGVLESRDRHRELERLSRLAVISRAGEVVDGRVLDGVFVADRGHLESGDVLITVVAALNSAGGGLLEVEQQVINGRVLDGVLVADLSVLETSNGAV